MIVKLLTEHHLEFLGLKRGCRGSSKSTHVKMPHCWKSHALAHFCFVRLVWMAAVSLQWRTWQASLRDVNCLSSHCTEDTVRQSSEKILRKSSYRLGSKMRK